jgi:YD repeat-containing protein
VAIIGKTRLVKWQLAAMIFSLLICSIFLPVAAVSATTIAYTYDNLNRLTEVDYGNGTTVQYTYDAAGNRLALTVNAPMISVLPSSPFNFVTVNVGDSLTQQFTVSNNGTADLTLYSIYIFGTNSSEFRQTNNCTSVAPNGSCTVTVTFIPTSGGTKSAALEIFSNDPNNQNLMAQLDGNACEYDVSPQVAIFGTTGGSGSESVTATNGCSWNALSNSGWVNITSSSGTGSGSVGFDVSSSSSSSSRNGTMTIAGQTVIVSQLGTGCTYSIIPGSQSFDAAGGTGTITVITQAGCNWTAQPGASWITITSGTSGSGSGAVAYSVSTNNDVARTGALAIGDQTLTVNQAGTIDPSCTNLSTRTASLFGYAYSYTIRDAYNETGDGGTIQAQALDFIEDLNLDIDKSVTVDGGYDCNYSTNGGMSAIDGTLTISNGTVTIENLIIQ